MTGEQFQAWARSLKLRSDPQIAVALGIHRNTARKLRHEGTAGVVNPLTIRLAMAAVSAGVAPLDQ